MVRKFQFYFHVNDKIGSDIGSVIELDLSDDLTDEQVNNEVIEAYKDWVWENTTQNIEEIR